MSEHTPGRLCISSESPKIIKACDFMGESSVIVGSASGHNNSGFFPTDEESVANARRLVAAWNACDGIETYALELMTGDLSIESQLKPAFKPVKVETSLAVSRRHEIKSLRAVNAELLDALEILAAYPLEDFAMEKKPSKHPLFRANEWMLMVGHVTSARAAIASASKQESQHG